MRKKELALFDANSSFKKTTPKGRFLKEAEEGETWVG